MGWNLVLRRMAMVSALMGSFGAAPLLAQSTTPNTPAATTPAAPPPVTPAAPAPATTPAPASSATPAQPTPSAQPPALQPAPDAPVAAPAVPAPPAAPPPAAAPAAPGPDTGNANPDRTSPDTSISQVYELQPRPVIMLSGKSTWDEGFKSINDAFAKLSENIGKADAKATGFPTTIFTQTDDAGFTFDAMIPVEKTPEGKPDLAAGVSFGMSPGGKVMKFQHRSAYDDIDSTYEAITAYLDEKGLEAKNMFAEEYLNKTKTSDDPSLEVDILVFLK